MNSATTRKVVHATLVSAALAAAGLALPASGQSGGQSLAIEPPGTISRQLKGSVGLGSEYVRIAVLKSGGFVAVWPDNSPIPKGDAAIMGQLFDATGKPGQKFVVSATIPKGDIESDIAALDDLDGGFVVVWSTKDGSEQGVRARRFTRNAKSVAAPAGLPPIPAGSSGAPADEFQVNQATCAHQIRPSVAGLDGGGFVVAWQDYSKAGASSCAGKDPALGYQVKARKFPDSGPMPSGAAGNEFVVNSTVAGTRVNPRVAALTNGGFAITWLAANLNATTSSTPTGVFARRFNPGGSPTGPEFLVDGPIGSPTPQYLYVSQSQLGIAPMADGGFVIANRNSAGNIAINRYFLSGGPPVSLTASGSTQKFNPAITGLAGGGFMVGWEDRGSAGGPGAQINGQPFDDGNSAAMLFSMPQLLGHQSITPAMASNCLGRTLVVWRDHKGWSSNPNLPSNYDDAIARSSVVIQTAVGPSFWERFDSTRDDPDSIGGLVPSGPNGAINRQVIDWSGRPGKYLALGKGGVRLRYADAGSGGVSPFGFGLGDFTMAAWVNIPVATAKGENWVGILDTRQPRTPNSPRGVTLGAFFGSLSFQIANDSGTRTWVAKNANVADGEWHHVAVTVSRSNPFSSRIYLDGIPLVMEGFIVGITPFTKTPVFDPSAMGASVGQNNPLFVGIDNISDGNLTNDKQMKVFVDEIMTFKRWLAPSEIQCIKGY